MVAQDEPDMRTEIEVEEDAMKAQMAVLGGDKDGNVTKVLEVNKIKDPSLLLAIVDEEIKALKINKNTKITMTNARLLQLFKKCHD